MSIEQAAKYTTDYILENIDKSKIPETDVKTLNERLTSIYFEYALLTTHSDIFIETNENSKRFDDLGLFVEQTRDQSTDSTKAIKKDLNKILKYIAEIEDMYHRNYVGLIVDEVINDKDFNKRAMFKELNRLEFICQEALRFYSPEQGRTPSKERVGRIYMVAEIMEIFKTLKIPHGSGEESSFYAFLIPIYEMFKIESKTPNRDIKEARQMLIDKKY